MKPHENSSHKNIFDSIQAMNQFEMLDSRVAMKGQKEQGIARYLRHMKVWVSLARLPLNLEFV